MITYGDCPRCNRENVELEIDELGSRLTHHCGGEILLSIVDMIDLINSLEV